MRFFLAVLSGVVLQPLFSSPIVAQQFQDNLVTPELHRLGEKIFFENCAICHGTKGEGNGALASEFSPRPRNFTKGSFKFQTTPYDQPPAKSDLIATIKRGIVGSYGPSMPAFSDFNSSEYSALAEVIRQFAGLEEYGTSIELPPKPSGYNAKKAQDLYFEVGCSNCHGDKGQGDGPAVENLVDQNNNPVRPADFTAGNLKGGSDLEQIWYRINVGLPGTPMPSFGQSLSTDELWLLAEWVSSLSK